MLAHAHYCSKMCLYLQYNKLQSTHAVNLLLSVTADSYLPLTMKLSYLKVNVSSSKFHFLLFPSRSVSLWFKAAEEKHEQTLVSYFSVMDLSSCFEFVFRHM